MRAQPSHQHDRGRDGARSHLRPRGVRRGPRRGVDPRGRAGESGLTSLEWLLIVAAVAALAAVAVVQVEKVVGETADHATSTRARKTAAIVAADQIMRDAARDASQQPLEAKIWDDWKKLLQRVAVGASRPRSATPGSRSPTISVFRTPLNRYDRVDAVSVVTAGATELFPNSNGTMGLYDLDT